MQSKAKFNITHVQMKQYAIKSLFYFLIIVIAYFSAYCTYNLAMTKFNNTMIAWMITIVVEGCLTAFSILYNTKSKGYILLYLAYLFVSIMASQGSITSDLDTKKLNNIHNSLEYKKYESDIASINNQIITYQNRLNTINGATSEINNSPAINDLNNKIAVKRNELRNTVKTTKTQRIRDDIQREIDSLERSKKELLNENTEVTQTKTASINESNNIISEISKLNDKKDELKKQLDDDFTKLGIGQNSFDKTFKYFGVTDVGFWTCFFILLEISRFALFMAVRNNTDVTIFCKIKNTILDWMDNGKTVVTNAVGTNNPNISKVGFNSSAHSPTSTVTLKKIGFDYPISQNAKSPEVFPTTKFSDFDNTQTIKSVDTINFEQLQNNKKLELFPTTKLQGFNNVENTKSVCSIDNNQLQNNENLEVFPTTKFSDFSKNDVIRYLDFMYDNQKKSGLSLGIRTIAKNINVTEEVARKIKGYLELKNIVSSEGLTTKILCSKSESLCKV